MIRIYERSLCQSYAGAYRAGIKIGEACEKCRNEIDYDQVRRRKAKAGEAS